MVSFGHLCFLHRRIPRMTTAEYAQKWRREHPGYSVGKRKNWTAAQREAENAKSRARLRKNPHKWREYSRTNLKNNRDHIRARLAVYYAVRTGKLIRPNQCSKCHKDCNPHAHHHRGYEFKLDVIWLCKDCHVFEHDILISGYGRSS